MKYWRRSSRWRKAWKEAEPGSRKRLMLWRIAEHCTPYGLKPNAIVDMMFRSSDRLVAGVVKMMARPDPYAKLFEKTLPDISSPVRNIS